MQFRTRIFEEPELEFGDRHYHQDPRLGLMEAGPLQTYLGDVIKVGVVGSSKTVEDTRNFIAHIGAGVEGKSVRHPNMHPPFPGLGNQSPYRCRFEVEEGATAALSQSKLDRIAKEPNHQKAVEMAVDEIVAELQALEEGGSRPDVAIIALPVRLLERVWNAKVDSGGTTEPEDSSGSDAPNFRGMLKAKAMGLSFPIQIVWEDVTDDKVSIPQKIKGSSSRKIQDTAGRSWNLMTSLYYKGSGRIMVLKTSRFKDEEADGIISALNAAGAELRDLVWVQESYSARVLREGNYPVMRGTFVDLGGKGLLYTSGSMPYYGTYPGEYSPNPLLLCPHPSCDSTIEQLAEEVLSMTKLNWNSTQMNQRLPIPIRAARKVGEVLKYVPDGQPVSTDYRKYI